MLSLTMLAITIGLAFSSRLRRIAFGTLSSLVTLLGGVLLLVWLMGSRSPARRRW